MLKKLNIFWYKKGADNRYDRYGRVRRFDTTAAHNERIQTYEMKSLASSSSKPTSLAASSERLLERAAEAVFPDYKNVLNKVSRIPSDASNITTPKTSTSLNSPAPPTSFSPSSYSATALSSDNNNNSTKSNRNTVTANEILSSLPLQMLLYVNMYTYPVWVIITLTATLWKLTYIHTGSFHQFLMLALWAVFVFVEPIRIMWGYHGNLRERVPQLAGHLLFSIFPIIPAIVFFMTFQNVISDGFALPIETALNILYGLIVLPQLVFGYKAAKTFIRAQAAEFFLGMDQDSAVDGEDDNGNGKKLMNGSSGSSSAVAGKKGQNAWKSDPAFDSENVLPERRNVYRSREMLD